MFGEDDRGRDITGRILTPIPTTWKTPGTARTAGRCKRAERRS
ncbi:hypothetical protein HMPREF1545_02294 [Oscillibacter sp. KLE 1728]|nr:hypothetical protein HMPREF1545_02294 [Oscillibacter sp. KLE 1728]